MGKITCRKNKILEINFMLELSAEGRSMATPCLWPHFDVVCLWRWKPLAER
jgi:hypothetical protein